MKSKLLLTFLIYLFCSQTSLRSQSVVREWNEILLEAIRRDEARPTVHARNLFHISAAMYDAWAAYEPSASTYFLGKTHRGFHTPFEKKIDPTVTDYTSQQEIAISYAAYRLIMHRFESSPGFNIVSLLTNALLKSDGLDPTYEAVDYQNGDPAALGNYIAKQIIDFGSNDGSNEANDYANRYYEPINSPLFVGAYGVGSIVDPNRWQPLAFNQFIGQSGIEQGEGAPEFVSPEWGQVVPFSLSVNDLTAKSRDGNEYMIYHDPGLPSYLSATNTTQYQWGFGLVAKWSSHLDPSDSIKWDISPASIGNLDINQFPETVDDLPNFYNENDGGDYSSGYDVNPHTTLPYEPQIVLRSDYARVLAEFWADGPDSETPPGHWFVLLNYVTDHPDFERKYQGQGEKMDALEWNVKSYFTLGGAMHDAAITAWGIKGYYDYIRPISAIRAMTLKGQCTDTTLPSYHAEGIPLSDGYIELIDDSDPQEFQYFESKVKIKSWKEPNQYYEASDETKTVDWVLGERWMPYQRPTFVTPPFAGYVSGHSTFSRAAAEVMTHLTGDEYFPGGMAEFTAHKNEFLVFEEGPSMDVTLQWAKYSDASDQCSLSRIWGGIHPPVDDIPGRLIGYEVGNDAFEFAQTYFNGVVENDAAVQSSRINYGPNPFRLSQNTTFTVNFTQPDELEKQIVLYNSMGKIMFEDNTSYLQAIELNLSSLAPGLYILKIQTSEYLEEVKIIVTD